MSLSFVPLDILLVGTAIIFILQTIVFIWFIADYFGRYKHLKPITRRIFLMFLSLLVSTAIFFLLAFTRITDGNVEVVITTGYFLYFVLFVFGLLRFFNKVIQIPGERRLFIRFVNIISYLIMSIVVTMILLETRILVDLSQYDWYGQAVEFAFLILSILFFAMSSFFFERLGKEREKNISKLVKARITLTRYVILAQIIANLALLAGTIILVFITQTELQDFYVEMGLGLTVSMINLGTMVILRWSVYIPQRVRKRFDLTAERFSSIEELQHYSEVEER